MCTVLQVFRHRRRAARRRAPRRALAQPCLSACPGKTGQTLSNVHAAMGHLGHHGAGAAQPAVGEVAFAV